LIGLRGGQKGVVMSEKATYGGRNVADGCEAVRMYPNNQLGPQVRKLEDAFSGFDVLREHFKKN
jgi:hypothetical protein